MTNNKQQTAVEWGVEKLASLTFDYMAGFMNKSEYDELSKGIIREAKEMEKQQRSIELPSDEEIWKWWKTQKFQKEQGEQEYTMLYEIDLPKILKAFIEHFSKTKEVSNDKQ